MSEEAAFVAALAADPSDRTAALVFADWLDERGDPVQAGTMAVMAIADTAQFDLARQRGRRY